MNRNNKQKKGKTSYIKYVIKQKGNLNKKMERKKRKTKEKRKFGKKERKEKKGDIQLFRIPRASVFAFSAEESFPDASMRPSNKKNPT